jgi:hypothetical protein
MFMMWPVFAGLRRSSKIPWPSLGLHLLTNMSGAFGA